MNPIFISVGDCSGKKAILRAECAESDISIAVVSVGESSFSFQKIPCVSAHENLLDVSVVKSETSVTVQENICVSASSGMIDKHESDEEERTTTLRLCGCSKNSGSTVLGVGESGKVRACYNKETNEKYALKVLRDGPKARREVELHYLVSCHENVLTIVDIYENAFGGVKCLLVIVEFASGGDLLTRFENQGSRPYPERMVGEIIRQVGSAVKYLHDMNIAHRDIKLENILCSSCDGSCVYKLADFGFAKRPERNTLMQSPCCTPFYVAPEILAREQYDKSCDMWALGVVTYILLCGYPPFYSMKGVPLSPGMKTRIASGCYKFPPAEWDHVTESSKRYDFLVQAVILLQFRLQPAESVKWDNLWWRNLPKTINFLTKNVIKHLLLTDPAARSTIDDLITSAFVKGQTPPRDDLSESPAEDDQEKLEGKYGYFQEEVGRAMDMMRLGSDTCFIKHPRLSCNSLLARRRNVISASLADGTQSVSVMGIS
ncbi:unnamed protein product [Toxocara canis]|uniref:non-specific serine/threonine protein kinase n=1 Tax=Toxocara canis TaxID=6265 RepID=A0A183VAN9_TOXCA|nr:unnamed protein product [Toxocara canis]